ncbi:hypothetical protein BC938DRAFT_478770 [Jimgerdemannia flammicorona]|uniref:Tetratricopeptide repeat protein n=1 Tax=Jimgerdemannia flammicorona TaxID=994334 RepID=A0A433QMA4_9FUNG|nr:hypothetical protein BC938DRAFT_478770 [Jimgerdemannia flammicorona]
MKCSAERCQDAISDFDAALRFLDPNDCYDVYYMRATANRQSARGDYLSPLKDALVDYNLFLELAPPEARKIPEALYSMAFCQMNDIQKATEYYDRGVEAEGKRLPVFGPCESAQGDRWMASEDDVGFQTYDKYKFVSYIKEHQKADWKAHKKEHKREGGAP